ncbi:MAG TPA: hypothetical protein VL949_04805 [Geobacteraceae bacterium]|jgi:hypothetical protein|nr:hypothetical protein [Geobacteraceae bacterium]
MKRVVSVMVVVAVMALGLFSVCSVANADEVKMVGIVTKIDVAKDGKSASATLKDNKSSQVVVVTVTDDLTLDKFKDHRIVEGDEIRCKYETVNGKKVSKFFRKTAGC